MTETTARPEVVAWMWEYLREHPGISQYAAVLAGTAAFRRGAFSHLITSWDLADAYAAARTPLTVADIPAGQGPASLYVDAESTAIRYRTANGRSVVVPAGWVAFDNDERDALNAALDRLAATLRTVTTEETP